MSSIRYICFILATITLIGCVTEQKSIKIDQVRKLEENTGYLFITLATNINYSQFKIMGEKYISLKSPDFYKDKNYYLVEVPAGQYEIGQFEIYHGKFDFDDGDELWEFSVSPGKISYVGELQVHHIKYRWATFELINNSSQALEYLEIKYPKILANRDLEYHGPGKDFFYDLIFNKSKGAVKISGKEEVKNGGRKNEY